MVRSANNKGRWGKHSDVGRNPSIPKFDTARGVGTSIWTRDEMYFAKPLAFCVLIFVTLATASSFYDNPEQDPLPVGGESDADLLKKWDFEVRCKGALSQHFPLPSSCMLVIEVFPRL